MRRPAVTGFWVGGSCWPTFLAWHQCFPAETVDVILDRPSHVSNRTGKTNIIEKELVQMTARCGAELFRQQSSEGGFKLTKAAFSTLPFLASSKTRDAKQCG